jgi:uracil-DNA glycosylase family 4
VDLSQHCDPGGPAPTPWVVCGEGPGADEVKENRGFVGQSGELLWPLTERYAGVSRRQCWVTNVSKCRLDDTLPSDKKLTPAEFEACRAELLEELTWIAQPKRVLAVGSIAARALMGDAFTTMDACNGMTWVDPHPERGWTVVPCFHPAAALRGGGEGKLGWTARAIEAWRESPAVTPTPDPRWVAIDTEGWPDDPIMLTFAYRDQGGKLRSGVVYPESVAAWWGDTLLDGETTIVWHNALWDWRVVEAMGVARPWEVPFEDTMERAYVRTCEPQGLKALVWKHLGVRMRDYDDVVRPYWEEMVKAYAEGFVAASTTVVHKPLKRGGFSKVGKVVVEEAAKPIKRVLNNPETLAERLGFGGPSLRYVPREEAEKYAVEDALYTLLLREVL